MTDLTFWVNDQAWLNTVLEKSISYFYTLRFGMLISFLKDKSYLSLSLFPSIPSSLPLSPYSPSLTCRGRVRQINEKGSFLNRFKTDV